MAKQSAGILLYRRAGEGVELLIAHMGGPLWSRKDEHAWSIPKGEPNPGEELLDAARREFAEELGLPVPDLEFTELGQARQSNGKVVTIWAGEADLDVSTIDPGTFPMEWPPRSGRTVQFPEVDRAEWVVPDVARTKLVKGQVVFVDRLLDRLSVGGA
ncbi:NUDIX domain-containing protein [Kineococcus sp. SYSU DK003]|uniref:NUDIX domain-containing protein n=1 Tax=Kineococcus sp. SYSU DK003 TaxID=3383124 RepID=UPI003D7C84D9